MQYASAKPLVDIQKTKDKRGVAIDKVGIRNLSFPITVLDRENQRQQTVATISMSVSLPHHFKGTHMSRFLEILSRHQGEVTMRTLPKILHDLKEHLESEAAHIEVEFPYFLHRSAPVSGAAAPMDYRCTFIGESNCKKDDFMLCVRVPVTTLCPVTLVALTIRPQRKNSIWELIWIEELIAIAEQSASAPVYPLLKRRDERHVTMQAFDNPVFVEDVVRNAARLLKKDERITWFEARALNQESIHSHSAFGTSASLIA